jgi:hypothetical protein
LAEANPAHLPHHPKVESLGLATIDDNEKEKRDKNGFKIGWPPMVKQW